VVKDRGTTQRLEPYSHPRAQLLPETTTVLRFHRLKRGHASHKLSRIVEVPVKRKSRESGISRKKTGFGAIPLFRNDWPSLITIAAVLAKKL
jgi:hypothetical protein